VQASRLVRQVRGARGKGYFDALDPDGRFINGSDFLMDGAVTAAYLYGELRPGW
jgi:hypothetical protein